MFKHIRRVVIGGGALGGVTLWLSTNSIPETIIKANGIIGANLKWLGWDEPPKALASTAADHTGSIFGIVLIILAVLAIISWGMERLFASKPTVPPSSAENPHLLAQLRNEYILSHDGISPAMMAGTEPIPQEWLDRRLSETRLSPTHT